MFKLALPRPRWQRAALAFSFAAFLAFLINLVFVLWAASRTTIFDGVGILAEQSCTTVKTWSTGIHVVINALSTILLAGSNYCMQCLMAPTRNEVDDAHAKQRWLDIGVPSIRNLWSIPWKKKIIWGLLAVSSLPLHFVYNSVIYISTPVNEYYVFTADPLFLVKNTSLLVDFDYSDTLYQRQYEQRFVAVYSALQNGQMEKLTAADCLASYGTPFQSTRGNLVLISPETETWEEYYQNYHAVDSLIQPSEWICGGDSNNLTASYTCDEQIPQIKPDEWRPHGLKIQECHSQKTDKPNCKILFSTPLCWIVISINLVKGILMLVVAFSGSNDQPLLTVGDAVASFLACPDESTTDMCLKSKKDFINRNWFKSPQRFDARPRRKFAAGTLARWITCILFFTASLAACISLLVFGLDHVPGDKNITGMGFGLNTKTVILPGNTDKFFSSKTFLLLLVNMPQVIFSLLYFTYNALYTNLSLVTEWDRFGDQTDAKGLRVSSGAKGSQRGTYFLQLPYRYSIPLLVCSGVLHWLISQSLFIVNLDTYRPLESPQTSETIMSIVPAWMNIFVDADGKEHKLDPVTAATITLGWSALGVILVVVGGFVMLGLLFVSAGRRLRFGEIPVAGSCSAAISAACHPNLSEKDASGELLRWGVVESEGNDRELGHCSFSAQPVRAPVQGQYYQ